jgi:hypothetical protein
VRIICPHAGPIADQTRTALDTTGRVWEPVDVSARDTAYTLLLQDLWSADETFAIVEHDIVIRPDTLDEFEDCDHPWCAFTYRFRATHIAGLGCTRFRTNLLAAYPDAVAKTWAEATEVHPYGHWCNLDDRLTRALTAAGATRHLHQPPVGHLNPMPTHGCG